MQWSGTFLPDFWRSDLKCPYDNCGAKLLITCQAADWTDILVIEDKNKQMQQYFHVFDHFGQPIRYQVYYCCFFVLKF